jgi:hypothetical protein
MKRKDALNLIKVEFAKHGEATKLSTRTYIENRVSFDAYRLAATAGVRIFEARI